ncbi:MAG: hypothetical protein ABII01_03940 [Candidatus Woesearchaeota archaeon]
MAGAVEGVSDVSSPSVRAYQRKEDYMRVSGALLNDRLLHESHEMTFPRTDRVNAVNATYHPIFKEDERRRNPFIGRRKMDKEEGAEGRKDINRRDFVPEEGQGLDILV